MAQNCNPGSVHKHTLDWPMGFTGDPEQNEWYINNHRCLSLDKTSQFKGGRSLTNDGKRKCSRIDLRLPLALKVRLLAPSCLKGG